MSQFYTDLQAGDLPNYSFVTPNICDDAHSCPLSAGDSGSRRSSPRSSARAPSPQPALFIVYDEGSTNDTAGGGGKVPCILVSPFAKPGYVSNVEYSHYSLLATVEAIFNLGSLGRNDADRERHGRPLLCPRPKSPSAWRSIISPEGAVRKRKFSGSKRW